MHLLKDEDITNTFELPPEREATKKVYMFREDEFKVFAEYNGTHIRDYTTWTDKESAIENAKGLVKHFNLTPDSRLKIKIKHKAQEVPYTLRGKDFWKEGYSHYERLLYNSHKYIVRLFDGIIWSSDLDHDFKGRGTR